jgi:general secretion pathway protein G
MKRRVRFATLIVVLVFALVCGFFLFRYPPLRRDRERTLKLDLFTMRLAIDTYTLDKQQPPQSLEDLVKEHYLKEIPTDPFTRKKDWVQNVGEIVLSPEQTVTGIADVNSSSGQLGSNGMAYNEW